MRKIGNDISRVIAEMGGDSDEARINMRVRQVLDRYRRAIESIYPAATARLHLAHTNKVIVKDVRTVGRNGESVKVRTLIVYVDESMYAAELNAQRELIKLRLLELFREEIEEFSIRISGKTQYKKEHPYPDSDSTETDEKSPSIPLNDDEKEFVSRTVGVVQDIKIQKSLEKAMTADLEWKKGEKVETERKNSK